MSVEAYPLHWPEGWPRTPASTRSRARFGMTNRLEHRWRDSTGQDRLSITERRTELTISVALDRLFIELGRFGLSDRALDAVVVSSNVPLRQDGLPVSGRRAPDDPGVAVYFDLDGPICLPCDRWDRVADNIAAISAHLNAMRGMDRWGVGSTAQHFAGFKALPPARRWWDILCIPSSASAEDIAAAHKKFAMQYHPDRGGNAAMMSEINVARDEGFRSVRERGIA